MKFMRLKIFSIILLFSILTLVSATNYGYNNRPDDSFLDLQDTPSTYAGNTTNCAVVNAEETGLIFLPCGNVTINQNISIFNLTNFTNIALINQSNDYNGFNQTTTGWWEGFFNWVVTFASPYVFGSFDGETLIIDFDESFLNATIDNKISGLGVNSSWNQSLADDLYVNIDGDVMTGNLNISNPDTHTLLNLHAVDSNGVALTFNQDGAGVWSINTPFASDDLVFYSYDLGARAFFLDDDTGRGKFLGDLIVGDDLDVTDNAYLNGTTWIGESLNVEENVTASWFKGLFNWTTLTDWLNFDGSILSFNETKLNETIEDKIKGIEYNATSINLIDGTLDSGNLESILIRLNGSAYNVSENTGANPLTIIINFTGVLDFDSIELIYEYSITSRHKIAIGIWECDDNIYEEAYQPDLIEVGMYAHQSRDVFDSDNHICSNVVSVRLRHIENGIISHEFSLDSIHLIQGSPTSSQTETDPFGVHANDFQGVFDSNFTADQRYNDTDLINQINSSRWDLTGSDISYSAGSVSILESLMVGAVGTPLELFQVGDNSAGDKFLAFQTNNNAERGINYYLTDGTTIRGFIKWDAREDLLLKGDVIKFSTGGGVDTLIVHDGRGQTEVKDLELKSSLTNLPSTNSSVVRIMRTGGTGTYPFDVAGNLVLQSRDVGALRDIVMMTGNPSEVTAIFKGTGNVDIPNNITANNFIGNGDQLIGVPTFNITYDNKNSSRWDLDGSDISYSAGNVMIKEDLFIGEFGSDVGNLILRAKTMADSNLNMAGFKDKVAGIFTQSGGSDRVFKFFNLEPGQTMNVEMDGNLVVDKNVNIKESLMVGSSDSPEYSLDVNEIGNSGGDLKLQADVQGDVILFGDTDVADDVVGKSFIINRKAAEGDASFKIHVNRNKNTQIQTVGGNMLFDPGSGFDLFFGQNIQSGTDFFFGSNFAEVNPSFKFLGYITANASPKFVKYQVNDITDNFELSREDSNIGFFDIQMPTIITDTLFVNDGNVNIIENLMVGSSSPPVFPLHILNGPDTKLLLQTSLATGSTAGVYFKSATAVDTQNIKGAIIWEDDGNPQARGKLHLAVDIVGDSGSVGVSDAKLTIAISGIGIEKPNPNQTLDVAGNVQAEGFITLSEEEFKRNILIENVTNFDFRNLKQKSWNYIKKIPQYEDVEIITEKIQRKLVMENYNYTEEECNFVSIEKGYELQCNEIIKQAERPKQNCSIEKKDEYNWNENKSYYEKITIDINICEDVYENITIQEITIKQNLTGYRNETKPERSFGFMRDDVPEKCWSGEGWDIGCFISTQSTWQVQRDNEQDDEIELLKAENILMKEDLCFLGISRWC